MGTDTNNLYDELKNDLKMNSTDFENRWTAD